MQKKQYTQAEFVDAARHYTRNLTAARAAVVIALHGDLGAGKTTFVQAVARTLGVQEDVVSPTFIIQKRYPLEGQPFSKLVHIDAYRLENAHELEVLGWDELARDPGNLICIEWPEHVADLLAPEAQHLYLEYVDKDTRSIQYGQKN